MHTKVGAKQNELEVSKNEVSYCKYQNDLYEGELENRKDVIKDIKEEYEERIQRLNEALKAKSKQLINNINRDQSTI